MLRNVVAFGIGRLRFERQSNWPTALSATAPVDGRRVCEKKLLLHVYPESVSGLRIRHVYPARVSDVWVCGFEH